MHAELPKIISVDDHVVEPPHLCESWLPARFREHGPRAERRGIGSMSHIGGGAYEQTFDDDGPEGRLLGLRGPRLHQQAARRGRRIRPRRHDDVADHLRRDAARLLRAQSAHRRHGDELGRGVAVLPDVPALLRPDVPRSEGPRARERVRATRTTTGWSKSGAATAAAGSIPLTLIPLWDVELAAAEVRRNAARGVHAVCFSEIPPKLGLPSIHSGEWDPFFAACEETNTVVCMHIGSSSQMPATSGDAPVAVAATLSFNNAMASLSDFLFSGMLVTFPNLKLAYSEGQIGWLPYVLERADDVWREHRAWGGVKDLVPEPPSTYYYRQVYGCFFRDRHGLEVARPRRRRQHHVRDRLPAHRLDVARHQEGRRGARRRPGRRRDLQDHAGQRDPHAQSRHHVAQVQRAAGAGTVRCNK